MSDGGSYDQEKMRQAAQKLDRASSGVLDIGRQLPQQVAAGPYAEHCAAVLKVLLEASTELGVRVQVAADGVGNTEWTVGAIEQANEDDAAGIDPDGDGGR